MEIHAWRGLNQLYDAWMTAHPEATQTSCAEAIGYKQSNLSLFLSGTSPIRSKAAMRFATFFKVPITDLRPDLGELGIVEENLKLLVLLEQSLELLRQSREDTMRAALSSLEREVEELSVRATDRARLVMGNPLLASADGMSHT